MITAVAKSRHAVMAWETQAIRWHGPSPENPHPVTAIFGRERRGL
jgi:hypothetical protein